MEGVIAGFGIPLLDFCVDVNKEFLDKYDLDANGSVQASQSQQALYNELSERFKVTPVAGGAAQNAIRIAQWVLGVPKSTTLFGCIGKDRFGDILQSIAEQEGVHVCYERHKHLATGKCAVMITDQNRCLCADFAAAKAYSINHLQHPEHWQLVQKARFIYVTGYFLHSSPACVKLLAENVAKQEQTFCFNLSAPYICEEAMEHIRDILPYVDMLFGNESEIKTLGKTLGFKDNCTTTQQIAIQVGHLYHKTQSRSQLIVITQGDKPTVAVQDSILQEYPVIDVNPDHIIDTCGAGDAFVGGFLAQRVHGKSIPECIRYGHYTASQMIQCQGIQIPRHRPDFT